MGQNLIGKKAGQRWSARPGAPILKYHILQVW
jgi:hypothetical protein